MALLLGALVVAGPAWAVGGSQVPEYELKAEFLVRFLGFVEWDPEIRSTVGPLVIGVFGDDPFDGGLEERVRGRSIGGHELQVRHIDRIEAIGECDLLFVSPSAASRQREIVAQALSTGTLTVGEHEGFARAGGIIQLFRQGESVRFEINPDAARGAGIRISAQLLSLARITDAGAPDGQGRGRR